jgi:hypothetical protein
MNEHLRDRVLRKLETLSDERGYQILDYVEFLESKYAERQPQPTSIFTRFSEAVEDRLRAGKVSASAIAETMGLMSRAMSVLNGVATGVAAAGRSVASDIATASTPRPNPSASPGGKPPASAGTSPSSSGAGVAGSGVGPGAAPPVPPAPESGAHVAENPTTTDNGELDPPLSRGSDA